MAKKYKITLTEEQMRVVQKCLEEYFRLRLGQASDFAEDACSAGVDFSRDNPDHNEIFNRYITKRNNVREMMETVLRIACGSLIRKTDDMEIAECIWDAIRFERGQSRWSQPFRIGPEPVPKIEKVEDENA